ncbi:hypothetical protein C0991_009065, partial [Blastosporella zonata]
LRVPADSSALNVATHLAPIVKDLQYLFEARFPHVKHGSVPIYLLGSGLQNADPEEAAVIMGHGITLLDAFEYFKKGRRETSALVPSVEDHKAFVWVALQYDRHLSGAIPLSIFGSASKPVQLKYHDEIKALSVHLEFAEWQDSLSNLSTEPSDFVIGMAALIIQNDMATWNVGGRPALPPIEFTLRGSLRLESAPLASVSEAFIFLIKYFITRTYVYSDDTFLGHPALSPYLAHQETARRTEGFSNSRLQVGGMDG